MALVTTADVKSILGISGTGQDDQIAALIPGAQAYVERRTGRYEQEADRIEYHDGDGRDTLFLTRRPIATTTVSSVVTPTVAIRVDGDRQFTDAADDLDWDDDFSVNVKTGEVRGGPFTGGHQTVRVTYTGGYEAADYPDDLKFVMAELVQVAMNRLEAAGLSGLTVGSYSSSVSQIDAAHLSLASREILKTWRRGALVVR